MPQTIKPVAGIFTYSVGISVVALIPVLPSTFIVAIIGTFAVSLTVLGLFRSSRLLPVGTFLLGVTLGLGYGTGLKHNELPASLEGQYLSIEGEIIGLPVQSEKSASFDFQVTEGKYRNDITRLRLSWFDAPLLIPGQIWQLEVRLRRPHGFASPGAFDFEAWAAREGIVARGHVRSGTLSGYSAKGIDYLRYRLSRWLEQNCQPQSLGLLKALLLGDKSGITAGQWELFNSTGTTHLLVISGLHIGLMALMGYWLTWLMAQAGLLPLGKIVFPRVAGCFSLGLAILYALLAGFGIPVQRALVMTAVAVAGPVAGVKPAPFSLLVIALAAVLSLDPLAVTSVGFWYSFMAVTALIYGLSNRAGRSSLLFRLLKPQWVVFCLLTPLLVFNGQPVSYFSPLINLVAIPFVGLLIVPLLLLSAGLGFLLPTCSSFLLGLLDDLLGYFLLILEPFAGITAKGSVIHLPGIVELVCVLIGSCLLIAPGPLGLRRMSPLFFIPLLFPHSTKLEPGQAKVIVLDVGQGLAVLIQTQAHTMVYDTGDAFSDRFNAADRVLIPYLRKNKVGKLDKIMISHGDKDHSGGLGPLTRHYDCQHISCGTSIPYFQQPVSRCKPGQQWFWDGVLFQVLGGGGRWPKSNDRSCVLKVTAGDDSLLLPGDIGYRVEKQLVKSGAPLKAKILLAPHHGSKYSSSNAFLKAVNPEQVLFSSGYKNQFGHPAKATVERYKQLGVQPWNTAQHGSLSFMLGNGNPTVSAYRVTHRRYWWE